MKDAVAVVVVLYRNRPKAVDCRVLVPPSSWSYWLDKGSFVDDGRFVLLRIFA